MIIVLHGDNQVASRERFVQLQRDSEEKGWNVIHLDGKDTSWDRIKISATSGSLLGEGNAVLVEGYFTKIQNGAKLGPSGAKLKVQNLKGTIVFWEPKVLSKILIKNFSGEWKVELFEIPRRVFQFLDTLSPKTTNNALRMLHDDLSNEPAELLLPLIAWHVRQLIWAKENLETLVVPYWKKDKLIKQASQFTKEQLFDLHTSLLTLDRNVKTGTSPLPLSSSLDLMIANL